MEKKMSYYTKKNVKLSDLFQYDEGKFNGKIENSNAILLTFASTLAFLAFLIVLGFVAKVNGPIYLIISIVLTIAFFALSSFLFSAHQGAVSRSFVVSEDGRVFVLENIGEHKQRKIIGLMEDIKDYEKLDITLAEKIINSDTPTNYYAYEIISAKSFLITPQGIAYKTRILKSIHLGEDNTYKKEKKRINISNRYVHFKKLVDKLENLHE